MMTWTKDEAGVRRSDSGYEIHYGKITIETAPEYRLTCYTLIAPDGEAICTRDIPSECEALAESDIERLADRAAYATHREVTR